MPDPALDDETARLAALREYALLDTAPEEAFDDLTRLAAFVCGAPIALISLVDAQRQWFKSCQGVELLETPREIAFCAHGIQSADVMIVPDALADARFSDNPLVTGEEHIRFYAGAPLVTPSGYPIGMICVKDTVPRELTPEQVEALRVLGRQVIAQCELRRQITLLETAIQERDRAAAERQSLYQELLAAQAATVAELATPLIPISDEVVILPLIGAVDGRRVQQAMETLLQGVAGGGARATIVDITGVPVVDADVAAGLVRIAQAVRLMGAEVVLTGIRPEVAQTLVGLGMELAGIVTRSTLQDGIAYAQRRT